MRRKFFIGIRKSRLSSPSKKARKFSPGLFRRRALDDYHTLQLLASNGFEPANTVCFHAQQYAEKMVKEKMTQLNIPVPKFHSITVLLNILNEDGGIVAPADIVFAAGNLESIYITSRYPDDDGQIVELSPETAENAYDYAISIVNWLESF